MKLLLLSMQAGALPGFLHTHVGRLSEARIGFVHDAIGRVPEHVSMPDWIYEERQRIVEQVGTVDDLFLAEMKADEVTAALDRIDALYVRGGNTFLLRDAMRISGADKLIVERVKAGLPYIGLSAGSVVAGPSLEPIVPMDDPDEAPNLPSYRGLGLIDSVIVPHADGQLPPYPPEIIEQIVATYGDRYQLQLLEDDQAFVVDERGERMISSAD
ncbi:Type 1 glutamine amidotransferase-like domain-containing protein [Gulosibacter faecalis]|jgi:dipeptidase E|uniref:Type 1 glutamine amidotransferase-like domain-containing protein n=1 Tax=Gulosibacter faecalis TaxID=272240 RepID=A0ABW5UUS5_9MICO|nr:Type 1 glutamine amidotransferase-like domain-containing protein [Gulosibacter faecalis]